MNILLVGDCHGKIPSIVDEDFDIVLAVGDICGESEEARTAMFESMDKDKEWYELLGEDKAKKIVKQSLEEGEEVFRHLSSFDVPVLVVPGNWDWTGEIYSDWSFIQENKFQKLVDRFENIRNLNFKDEKKGEYTIIGYGPCSGPEIPQYEDEKPKDESEMEKKRKDYQANKERLEKLFDDSSGPRILLSHNVPFDTSLDEIKNEDSPVHGRHYGSLIVKELIEEYRPLLSVAGHMHEGQGEEQVGQTLAVNSGLNTTAVIEIEDQNISVNWFE